MELGDRFDTFLNLEGIAGLVFGKEFLDLIQERLGVFGRSLSPSISSANTWRKKRPV